ncbi:MAG: GNAT family N-acetyltransferase [Gallionellaceae bacterium]
MKKIDLSKDIYFLKEYASLYLAEGENLFEFDYRDGSDRFYNLTVKRPIYRIGNRAVDDGYYDLETAYGYGGYYSTTGDQRFLEKALSAYHQQCMDERIIAEFIRFHPYNAFPSVNNGYLDFIALDRQTVSIDLTLPKEGRWLEYSSTTRNILRKAATNLEFHETEDIDGFMHLYQSTMKKNNANSFYYFTREYYEKLLAIHNVKLFAVTHENHTINMSFVLFGNDLAHYHLSANDMNFSKFNGNYFLLDSVCDFVKLNHSEISQFHLGGGRSNLDSDSLLAFKSKFSNIRNAFYIAGKIFNRAIYQQYTEALHASHPELRGARFFLKYRMGVI